MTTIANFKTSIRRAKNVEELATLLRNTNGKFTFWGARKVINNAEDEIPLETVTKKAIFLITPLLKDWDFTEQDRINIKKITKKINHYYRKTDHKFEKSLLLTKIVYLCRNVFSIFYSTKKRWDDICKTDPSNYYTRVQYMMQYQQDPTRSCLGPGTPDKKFKSHQLFLPPPIPPSPPRAFNATNQPCIII